MTIKRKFITILLVSGLVQPSAGAFRLAPIFTDHLVLAHDKPARVFGTGEGTVKVSFRGQEVSACAVDGAWCAILPAGAVGGPFELTVSQGEELTVLSDVMVGDVLVLAGQSNMRFSVEESTTSRSEWVSNPLVRSFSTTMTVTNVPNSRYSAKDGWVPLDRKCAGAWSAIGYEAAIRLARVKNTAVGLINVYQGASIIQAWMPKALARNPMTWVDPTKRSHSDEQPNPRLPWNRSGFLYERQFSEVKPFMPTAVLWYQGEANTGSTEEGDSYAGLLTALIGQWRTDFGDPSLPFYVFELADRMTYYAPQRRLFWDRVQASQRRVAETVPFTHLVRTADVCEVDKGVHPPTKRLVSARFVAQFLGDSGCARRAEDVSLSPLGSVGGKVHVTVDWRASGLKDAAGRDFFDSSEGPFTARASFYDSTSTEFCGESEAVVNSDGTMTGAWLGAEPKTTYRTFLTVTDNRGSTLASREAELVTGSTSLALDYTSGLGFKNPGTTFVNSGKTFGWISVGENENVSVGINPEASDAPLRALGSYWGRAVGETAKLQRQIDAASAAGGGVVTLEAGEHPITSVFLKSNVTLELKKNARLFAASTNRDDYLDAVLMIPGDHRKREWRDCCTAVVCANNATNIAIVGEGVIDGCCVELGDLTNSPGRYRNVLFYRCRGIRVEGVTLQNACRWTCYFKECEDVVVRKAKVRSVLCWGNDGFDIEARHVLIEDCDIEADDDAVCLKNFRSDFVVEDVEVRNCRIAANCDHFKIGTETFGGFRNIRMHDCEFVRCSTNLIPRVKNEMYGGDNGIPGWTLDTVASRCGIALECVDGGFVDNVRIWNVRMNQSTQTPVFIRLSERRRNVIGRDPYLRNVVIENVTGEAVSQIASSITGVSGLRPTDITLRNVRLKLMGGVTGEMAQKPVPEVEKGYPTNKMFDKHPLPAFGLYVRHADRVALEDVKMVVESSDARQDVVLDDVTGFSRR